MQWIESFLTGLATPLGAVCVLPLYPGFLSYLANKLNAKEDKWTLLRLSLLVTLGIIIFMLTIGIIFTTLLQSSLNIVISYISPIAFGILFFISILLIFNYDFSQILPQTSAPMIGNPNLTSFVFGLFFGAIVIPCNPGFIAIFFARNLIIQSFFSSMLNFFMFGFGMASPLILFAILSGNYTKQIIVFLTNNKRVINLIAGLLMLGLSTYELIFVFKIFG